MRHFRSSVLTVLSIGFCSSLAHSYVWQTTRCELLFVEKSSKAEAVAKDVVASMPVELQKLAEPDAFQKPRIIVFRGGPGTGKSESIGRGLIPLLSGHGMTSAVVGNESISESFLRNFGKIGVARVTEFNRSALASVPYFKDGDGNVFGFHNDYSELRGILEADFLSVDALQMSRDVMHDGRSGPDFFEFVRLLAERYRQGRSTILIERYQDSFSSEEIKTALQSDGLDVQIEMIDFGNVSKRPVPPYMKRKSGK